MLRECSLPVQTVGFPGAGWQRENPGGTEPSHPAPTLALQLIINIQLQPRWRKLKLPEYLLLPRVEEAGEFITV